MWFWDGVCVCAASTKKHRSFSRLYGLYRLESIICFAFKYVWLSFYGVFGFWGHDYSYWRAFQTSLTVVLHPAITLSYLVTVRAKLCRVQCCIVMSFYIRHCKWVNKIYEIGIIRNVLVWYYIVCVAMSKWHKVGPGRIFLSWKPAVALQRLHWSLSDFFHVSQRLQFRILSYLSHLKSLSCFFYI